MVVNNEVLTVHKVIISMLFIRRTWILISSSAVVNIAGVVMPLECFAREFGMIFFIFTGVLTNMNVCSTMQGRRMRCKVHVLFSMSFLFVRDAKENTTINVNCECRQIAIVQRFPLLPFVSISPFVFGLCAMDEASICTCVSEKEFRMNLHYKQM